MRNALAVMLLTVAVAAGGATTAGAGRTVAPAQGKDQPPAKP